MRADFSWFCFGFKQACLDYNNHSLYLFTQVLLIVAPQKKSLFEFASPILKTLVLRANVSELERLAIRDGILTVCGAASIHVKILWGGNYPWV